jgi:arsenite-transporting ATPase
MIVVTLPETRVHEAARLQEDLRRAKIEPFAWGINQSLVPLEVSDRMLRSRQQHELPFIDEVKSTLAKRVALIPWQIEAPVGVGGLRRITQLDSTFAK